jgi:uncharacterized membrane protein (DUF4010 family)
MICSDAVALGLAVSMAVGGLIGLERERWARQTHKRTFGGARTYPLIALAGALSALLARALGGWALLAGFSAFAALLAVGYLAERREPDERSELGLTSEVAALLVFGAATLPFLDALGLPFEQRLMLTAGIGTVVLAVLAVRERAHAFAEALSSEDVRATTQFALLAVVVLPLLPDEQLGPFGFFNPFNVGVVVVLIAAISFVGYVAVRVLGARRGIGLAAVAGGLVSSTAVTLTFSGRGRSHPRLATACALAVVLASTIMFPRMLVEVGVMRPQLLGAVAPALGVMVLGGLAGCAILWWRVEAGEHDEAETAPRFSNPFSLPQAIRLGALYVAVRFVAAAAYAWLGQAGLFASAGLAGLSDVDAITISVARMHASGLDSGAAAMAIALAGASNTLAKAALALGLGGRRVGLPVVLVLLPTAVAGVVTALLLS